MVVLRRRCGDLDAQAVPRLAECAVRYGAASSWKHRTNRVDGFFAVAETYVKVSDAFLHAVVIVVAEPFQQVHGHRVSEDEFIPLAIDGQAWSDSDKCPFLSFAVFLVELVERLLCCSDLCIEFRANGIL